MTHLSHLARAEAQPDIPEPSSTKQPAHSGFGRLRSRTGGPLKVAILSDFTRVSYANGAVFQTRSLYRELRRAGHSVTIIGPGDPDTASTEATDVVQVPSWALRTYPGVRVPLPLDRTMFDPHRWDFDIVFGQTTSLLIEFGIWLRKMKGIPLLCVNTTHLPAAYEVLLPEKWIRFPGLRSALVACLRTPFERLFRDIYNESDGLIVLSRGLEDYWTRAGVTVPIHVIPRAVSRDVFEAASGSDPYEQWLQRFQLPVSSQRLLCAGRHTPEKEQDRVIRIFAKHVAPRAPNAVLFLVGTGPHKRVYESLAAELGVRGRVIFTGEVPFQRMPDYYHHADLFLHASRSETFGNVLGEALWSAMAVVAFADGMGVSAQVRDRQNGYLIEPSLTLPEQGDRQFGEAVVSLLGDALARRRLGKEAARIARLHCSPEVVQELTASAFERAQDHVKETIPVPCIQSSALAQWTTTVRHVQRWATIMGGVYLAGQLRAPGMQLPSFAHPGLV